VLDIHIGFLAYDIAQASKLLPRFLRNILPLSSAGSVSIWESGYLGKRCEPEQRGRVCPTRTRDEELVTGLNWTNGNNRT
jgi:hypothetical protein